MQELTLPVPMQMVSLPSEPRFASASGFRNEFWLPEEFNDYEGLSAHIEFNRQGGLGYGAELFTYDAAARCVWYVYYDKCQARCYRVSDVNKEVADHIIRATHAANTAGPLLSDEALFFEAARRVLAEHPTSEVLQ
jgi:hypothetical protein